MGKRTVVVFLNDVNVVINGPDGLSRLEQSNDEVSKRFFDVVAQLLGVDAGSNIILLRADGLTVSIVFDLETELTADNTVAITIVNGRMSERSMEDISVLARKFCNGCPYMEP